MRGYVLRARLRTNSRTKKWLIDRLFSPPWKNNLAYEFFKYSNPKIRVAKILSFRSRDECYNFTILEDRSKVEKEIVSTIINYVRSSSNPCFSCFNPHPILHQPLKAGERFDKRLERGKNSLIPSSPFRAFEIYFADYRRRKVWPDRSFANFSPRTL